MLQQMHNGCQIFTIVYNWMFEFSLINKDYFEIGYNVLYGFTFIVAILGALNFDIKSRNTLTLKTLKLISLWVVLAFILLVGLREYNVGTDTDNYYRYSWQLVLKSQNSEFLFDWLIAGLKALGFSFTVFLLFISFIFFYVYYKSLTILAHYYDAAVYFILFTFVSLFFASTMSINVIRQGVSLVFLVLAYSLWLNTKGLKGLILPLVLAVLCHKTALIPMLVFVLCERWGKTIKIQYYMGLYIIGIVLAKLNFGILNIAPFLQDSLKGETRLLYLTDTSEEYSIGFKLQFVAFNTVFVLLFYYISKNILKPFFIWKENYEILFRYYLVTSFIFFMAFQIPYSDRWGLFSWITIPLLVTPVFSVKIKRKPFATLFVLFFGSIYLFFKFYE